jgi:uncharacterized protein (DUF3820 family)
MKTEVGKKIMPFGKHKGKPLENVPSGYLLWLYDRNKLPPWLRKYAEETISVLRFTVNK